MLRFWAKTNRFILSLGLLLSFSLSQADILHLELGAANYGAASGNSRFRFTVLGEALRELVRLYGKKGTIYLNDIDESGLEKAMDYAKFWVGEHHYDQIKIIALPGDYHKIELPFVKTMTLSNPGHDQLPIPNLHQMREEADRRANRKLVNTVEKIAAHSETGLKISSYFYRSDYPAASELGRLLLQSDWVDTGTFGSEYIGPDGQVPTGDNRLPKIYYIKPRCGPALHEQLVE